jgi:AraC-like DNA-binding protein
LLNEYRVREAQRLFAQPDAAKYTIESVSLIVGYKSRSTFREAFAEITGVSPSFYLKSIQNVSC